MFSYTNLDLMAIQFGSRMITRTPLFPILGTQVFEYKVHPITITRKSVWQAVANRSNLAQEKWRKLPTIAHSSNCCCMPLSFQTICLWQRMSISSADVMVKNWMSTAVQELSTSQSVRKKNRAGVAEKKHEVTLRPVIVYIYMCIKRKYIYIYIHYTLSICVLIYVYTVPLLKVLCFSPDFTGAANIRYLSASSFKIGQVTWSNSPLSAAWLAPTSWRWQSEGRSLRRPATKPLSLAM